MKIRIQPLPDDGPVTLPRELGFGRIFSRRMFQRAHEPAGGWGEAAIGPLAPLSLDPASQLLHCGQAIFEGTKAYRRPDGRIQLFRPEANAERFRLSARRLALPEVDPADFVAAVEALVALEHRWVPAPPSSLYIRPLLAGVEATLEVRASRRCVHAVFLSPVGPFFPGGFHPVAVRVETAHTRAGPGGTGAVKTVGNYASSLAATEAARAAGYQQVLWLDAAERRYVEEAGAMNVAFVTREGEILTPALTGSILPGITRDTLLQLAPTLGFGVRELRLPLEQVLADIRGGRITEVFCMGTAAVLAPVGRIGHEGGDVPVGDGSAGPVATRLYQALTDIQFGRAEDRFGWTRVVDEAAARAHLESD